MRTSRAASLLLLALDALGGFSLVAQPSIAGGEDGQAKRRATINYGIESEIVDLLQTLGAEKEDRYNDDLEKLFSGSRTTKLRSAILDFWRVLAWKGGEGGALDLVKERDKNDPILVAAALSYLAEIRSKQALDYASVLIEENDKNLLPPLVTLLGRAGSAKEEELLLKWLGGDAPTPALREAAIRALGDMGSTKSSEALGKILEDSSASRFERVFSSEALGKIGAANSLASLIKAANGEDATVRAAAVEALGSFDGGESEKVLLEALRDSYAKSRIAACKALAKRHLSSALPNLRYKATNDPDKGVKYEALRAMAAIGGSSSFDFLQSVMEDKKAEGGIRVLAFGLLARDDFGSRRQSLVKLLETEALTVDRVLYTSLVREIAAASDAKDIADLARVLLSDKDYLIRLGAVEWARGSKAGSFSGDLATLASQDPVEAVRKRAAEVLSQL